MDTYRRTSEMALSGVALGPMASRLLSGQRWTDEYPAWPIYADELERLLAFAGVHGRLTDFVARLDGRNGQRDDALAEMRVAYFLSRSGFPVVAWEPPGLGKMKGEYTIRSAEDVEMFAELKSPGWESEVGISELLAGRAKQPKYREGDGGGFANWRSVRRCIASPKTYPKFSQTQPNLLIIADDLFVNLHHGTSLGIEVALYAEHDKYGDEIGYFKSAKYQNLGGVAIFAADGNDSGVAYRFRVFGNPFALPATRLPESLLNLHE
jgi:hypothetical protein